MVIRSFVAADVDDPDFAFKARVAAATRRRALLSARRLQRPRTGSMRKPVRGYGMPVRLKKLIGTILLIALVIVYALIATIIAVAQLAQSGPLVHFLYFLITGLLWILPAMAIIRWMIVPGKRGG